MILVVFTTILSLLALLALPKTNAQGPVDFDYPSFDASSASTLNVLYNASIDTSAHVLKVTDPSDTWCDSHVCRGQIIYSSAIDFIDRTVGRTYSFSTSFVFSLTIPGSVRSGQGFAFLLIANPYENQGNGIGDYFGAFPSQGQTATATIAVEFDTLKNSELYDIDDNHVGVDINKAASASQESCYPVNLRLFEGQKIKVWIDYYDSFKTLEVRLAYWASNVVRPVDPLLEMNLDLSNLVESTMYLGFSGESYSGQEQESAIYSWSFISKLEAPAPPPPPRAPLAEIGDNGTAPPLRGNLSRNHTRSKEENMILGFCIGGGLGLILCIVACFCLGCYCSKKAAEAAKAKEEKSRKKSEAGGYAEEHHRKYHVDDQEQNGVSNDIEAAAFGEGIFAPLLISGATSRDVNDPHQFTPPLRKRRSEFLPKSIKSARELEAQGVEADAIKRGIVDIGGAGAAAHGRRSKSYKSSHAQERAAKRRRSWSPPSPITGLESLPEEETSRGDVAASPHDQATGVLPDTTTPRGGLEEGEVSKTELPEEKEFEVASASPEIIPTAGRGDDADSGTSDIVYSMAAQPSASIKNAARRSNSWSLWNSEVGASSQDHQRRPTSPLERPPGHRSSVQIKRTKSWGPWGSGRTREVEVVVRRSEAIRPPKKPHVITIERNPASSSSPRRDSEARESIDRTSSPPTTGTIMYSNTLYDSPSDESHEPSEHPPRQTPPEPGDELYMDDNIYVRPTDENIYDRPPDAASYGEEIVERIFDVEIRKENKDVDRLFDSPDAVPRKEITITRSVSSSSPAPQSGRGSRLSSPTPTQVGSPKAHSVGTTTPNTAGTSGSSSTHTTKDFEHPRAKRPNWRY